MGSGAVGLLHESGGGIDVAGGADGGEEGAAGQRRENFLHVIGHLAEPDDVGSGGGGLAGGAGMAGVHFGRGVPPVAAGRTERAGEAAVHVDHLPGAALFMQRIDILGDEGDCSRIVALKTGDGAVRGIRGHGGGLLTARVVEGMDEGGVAGEALGGGDLLDPAIFPEATGAAKGAHAAFGRDPGPGENDDMLHPCASCVLR